MELDRRQLDRLLALDDAKFKKVLTGLAGEYGIDSAQIKISDADVARLRLILSTASYSDIQSLISGFKGRGSGV